MRIGYLLREAFVNMRRNGLIVLGAVLAAFLTLLLAFGAVVFSEMARSNTSRWEEGIRVIAFLNAELSFDATTALHGEVSSWDGVDEVIYFSNADAFEEAQEMFEDDPAILEIIEEDPSILPASLRIRPEDSDTYAAISDRLEATPGVQEVLRQDETIEEARDFNDLINQLILIAAVALGVVAVVLIANTIRMAIYARRDEIGIMKLVGAGNWFIRVPFLLEGMFEGLIGAVLAIALVFGGYQLLLDRRDDLPALIDPEISTEFILQWGLITLAAGVLVGILGSGIALRRFLRE